MTMNIIEDMAEFLNYCKYKKVVYRDLTDRVVKIEEHFPKCVAGEIEMGTLDLSLRGKSGFGIFEICSTSVEGSTRPKFIRSADDSLDDFELEEVLDELSGYYAVIEVASRVKKFDMLDDYTEQVTTSMYVLI